MIHRRNIDTAALYPHWKGLPFKQSLKKLVSDFSGREIQQGVGLFIELFILF